MLDGYIPNLDELCNFLKDPGAAEGLVRKAIECQENNEKYPNPVKNCKHRVYEEAGAWPMEGKPNAHLVVCKCCGTSKVVYNYQLTSLGTNRT